ncbi:MAG: hypothetical protein AMJ66_00365 [Betaproteobacteria bacterium SG8_40]|nr:MAG: hypothetical protein AMJ66_00365 [Betaproteobacteria bacterium SG8_40]
MNPDRIVLSGFFTKMRRVPGNFFSPFTEVPCGAFTALLLSVAAGQPGALAAEEELDAGRTSTAEVQCESCDDGLTGDWGGRRRSLAQAGIDINLSNTGDVFFIRQGGTETATYTNLFSAGFSFDMERLASMDGGSAYLWVVDTRGDDPADVIGSVHAPSNIAAADAFRLLEAWYEQSAYDDRLGVLAGFYAVDSEFDSKYTTSVFISGSFGTGLDLSESGLNGPSIFPVTAFGTRIRYDVSEEVKVRLALLDGVPGKPDDPTATGVLDFSSDQGVFAIGEVDWETRSESSFRRVVLGAWHYTTTFDDLLDTEPGGSPLQRKGSGGFYGFIEGMLVPEQGSPGQGLAGIVRVGVADDDVNQVAGYYGAGLVYRGLFPGRDHDSIGIGFSTAVNGDKYQQAQALAGQPVTDSETELVLVYSASVNTWLQIQPTFEYIIDPGTDPAADNAFLAGLRIGVLF